METDLRRSPRVPFIASAEVIEVASEVCMKARTGDISRHGCYMDMLTPLPLGTTVKVQITNDAGTFAAIAGVVFTHSHLGMGLAFQQIEPSNQTTLERWLNDSSSA